MKDKTISYSKFRQSLKEFREAKPMREIKINFAPLIGIPIILYNAYQLWSGTGIWLAVGVVFMCIPITLTFKIRG